jgi:hypothetical protein
MKHMMRELALTSQIQSQLENLLNEIPSIRLKESREDMEVRGAQIDLTMDVTVARERWRLLVETATLAEPRLIRGVVQQLQSYLADRPKSYGIVGAPYIAPGSRNICKEAGVGFVDLAGNCRLAFGQVFIERQGFPNPKLERRPLRNLFTPKASRALRVLLEDAKQTWQVQAIAKQAQVSLGLAFKVKQRLLDLEYAQEEDKGLRLIKPEELLRQWATNYSYLKSGALDCFAIGDPPVLEQALTAYCRQQGMTYALALFSGAARVAPFARYSRGFAYAVCDAASLARDLGWKPVPSGANFTILTPYDEGLLYGARHVNSDVVVGDIQLYLDLASYTGRGEEAAAFIMEQRLRPRW